MQVGVGEQAVAAAVPVYAERIVDSQVHVWLLPSAAQPWAPGFLDQLPPELAPRYLESDRSSDELVRMMDDAGVATAFLTSPWLYGSDHSYVFDSALRFDGRFAVVGPYGLPLDGPESAFASFRHHSHALGPRLFFGSPAAPGAALPPAVIDEAFAAASSLQLPVFVSPMGQLAEVARAAEAFPDVTLVLDHAGLWLPAPISERWSLLPAVLALATSPNVLVKCTALPELSSMPYPYNDLWRILHPLLDHFGADRLMWGSDINQHRDALSYAQSLDYIRDSAEISDADRTQILGGTAARLLAVRPVVGASARSIRGE